MNEELKSLIEDAAKLLSLRGAWVTTWFGAQEFSVDCEGAEPIYFNPCDPERGDLEKLMDAARLTISYSEFYVEHVYSHELFHFTKGDHASKVLAILRAASAVLHSRGGV